MTQIEIIEKINALTEGQSTVGMFTMPEKMAMYKLVGEFEFSYIKRINGVLVAIGEGRDRYLGETIPVPVEIAVKAVETTVKKEVVYAVDSYGNVLDEEAYVNCEITFINLTPHVITEVITNLILQSEGVARVATTSEVVATYNGIDIFNTVYGELQGLPKPKTNTLYIVSGLVLDAAKRLGRDDCIAPGELVRDDKGQPIGCKGFRI